MGLSTLEPTVAWAALYAFATFFLFKVLGPATRPSWDVNADEYPPTFVRPWLMLGTLLPTYLDAQASQTIGDELGKLEVTWWNSVSSSPPAYGVSDWHEQVLRTHDLCWQQYLSGVPVVDTYRRTRTNWHPRVQQNVR